MREMNYLSPNPDNSMKYMDAQNITGQLEVEIGLTEKLPELALVEIIETTTPGYILDDGGRVLYM